MTFALLQYCLLNGMCASHSIEYLHISQRATPPFSIVKISCDNKKTSFLLTNFLFHLCIVCICFHFLKKHMVCCWGMLHGTARYVTLGSDLCSADSVCWRLCGLFVRPAGYSIGRELIVGGVCVSTKRGLVSILAV